MFISRLDSARKVTHHSPSESSSGPKKPPILQDLSEYLFDLFDANCMPEFQEIERFEEKALKSFDSEDVEGKYADEYTHEQYMLHQDFLALFEKFIGNFLTHHNYTFDDLYTELSAHKKLKTTVHTNLEPAGEVIDVLSYYVNFPAWVTMMRENAKLRRHYKTFREQLLRAVDTK
ncbi:hypothetical protein EON63_08705 [archaeon]|nr:MAG: hypothetical protein EON63_08705 [archaeon]